MGKPGGNKKNTRFRGRDSNSRQRRSDESEWEPNDDDMEIFIEMAQQLKEDGNQSFQRREYDGAMFKYDKAIRLLPRYHTDIAYLHSNLAACYMQKGSGDYRKALDELNLALEVSPKYSKALLKRARCYEALNRLDYALNDVGSVLRFEPNNLMAQEIAERVSKSLEKKGIYANEIGIFSASQLKEASSRSEDVRERSERSNEDGRAEDRIAEQRHNCGIQNMRTLSAPQFDGSPCNSLKYKDGKDNTLTMKRHGSRSEYKPVLEGQQAANEETTRPIKLVFSEDIRWARMPQNCTVSKLREIIMNRFLKLKSFLIKYKDLEGDLVTITTTEELRWAEASTNQRGAIRFFIMEVDPEWDPLFSSKSENESKILWANQTSGSSYVDDWIVDFAQLFKNYVGFDSDGYLKLHDVGMRIYSEAIEDTVTSEEAQSLFDIAEEKFQEMAALALFNWGNVHVSKARKRVPLTEDSNQDLVLAQVKKAFEWAEREYEKAGDKYKEAVNIKPDFYEGYLAMGQQQFELAKLAWYYELGSKGELDDCGSMKVIDLFEEAQENIARGTDIWEKLEEQHAAEVSNQQKEKGPSEKMQLGGPMKESSSRDDACDFAPTVRSQINILWGTVLYERSIFEFKLGNDIWEDYLEASIDRFEHAGASEIDIGVMIKNHCSNVTAQEGLTFKIDEIVQAWNEMYDAKKWRSGVSSFRLEPLLRRRVSKLHRALEHL